MVDGEHYNFVHTGQSEKMVLNVLSAISTNTSVMLRGPAASGKSATVAMLSNTLAKPCFKWRFSDANDFASLHAVLVGTAQGGFVTMIQNCETLSVAMISTLANIIFAVRTACMHHDGSLQYLGNPIKVCSLQIIINRGVISLLPPPRATGQRSLGRLRELLDEGR